ncbi:MAG: ERF family protein [Thermodesulfobacteriota bacterium]
MSENERDIREQAMSPTIHKLAKALSFAQGEMEGAKKGSENPFFRKKYADLWEVWTACREQLSKNGLAVVQTTEETDTGDIMMITTLMHESGEWIRGRLRMKPVKQDPQGYGSCITYARRYSLAAIVGVCPEDDDGNAASKSKNDVLPPKEVSPGKAPASLSPAIITKQQGQDIFLKATANGWPMSAVKDYMADVCGVEKSAEIKVQDYSTLMRRMDSVPMICKRQLARMNILLDKVCPGILGESKEKIRKDQHNMVGDALQVEPPKSLNDLAWEQADKVNDILGTLSRNMDNGIPKETTEKEPF